MVQPLMNILPSLPGLRIKETKEVYEGEVTELTPCETENPMGGYGKTISHVIIGLKTAKGTKQLKVSLWGTYLDFPVLCGSGRWYNLCLGSVQSGAAQVTVRLLNGGTGSGP